VTLLHAALAYAADGWSVFPVVPRGKVPMTPRGFLDATTDPATIAAWWTATPLANIGGVPASVGCVAFDVDTPANWEAAERLGLLAEPTHRVTSGNVAARACHLYFTHPDPDVTSLAGMVARSGRGYVILPPSIHPTGNAYASDTTYRDALPLPPMAVLALLDAATPAARRETTTALITAVSVNEGDRHAALLALAGKLAQARLSEPEASVLVHAFNDRHCRPPKDAAEVDRILTFTYARDRANHPARHVARVDLTALERSPVVGHIAPAPDAFDDDWAINAPGMLGTIARWSLATAPCPVPIYALAAALAIGSVAAGRRYAMSGTFSPLYLLVAGRTASGKEWVKRTITDALSSVDPRLVGPGDFSSEGAVLSTLRDRPQLVAVMDEFGQQLAAAKGPGTHHRQGAMRMLMEAWGAAGGTLLGKAMSTLGHPPGEAPPPVTVLRPCLVAVGLTTPERLHTALESAHVGDGFLNRWLLLEHDAPRTVPMPRGVPPVPEVVTEWIRGLTPAALPPLATTTPPVHDVPLTDEAFAALQRVSEDATGLANALDVHTPGAGGLWGRAGEQVRRLTLIAALADAGPLEAVADVQHVTWARAVVWWSMGRLIVTARDRIGDSPMERARSKVLAAVVVGGADGVSRRTLMRGPLKSLTLREVDVVLETLVAAQSIRVEPAAMGSVMVYAVAPDD
jgi:hypothetical protein